MNSGLREFELENRDAAVEKGRKSLQKYSNDLVLVNLTKPWIPEDEILKAWTLLNETLEWLDTSLALQKSLQLWEPLVFTSSLLENKVKSVEKIVEKLNRMNKPKDKVFFI